MQKNHLKTLEEFKSGLPEGTDFFIKDVIDFVINEKLTDAEALEYINDVQSVNKTKLDFHKKWIRLTNMKNVVEYGEKEIESFKKLIQALE